MSILATCATCRSQFKAPDYVGGRRTRCPRCGTPIDLPSADAPPSLPEAARPSSPVAATSLPPPKPRPSPPPAARDEPAAGAPTWLLAGGAAGLSLLIVLGMILAAKLIFRGSPALETVQAHEGATKQAGPAAAEGDPPAEPKKTRAERLAEHDALEKETLAALEHEIDRHKPALERLRKEEDDLFRKPKFAPAKVNARLAAYRKELAALVPAIAHDVVQLIREKERFAQARRKILFDEPEPDDPKLEDYAGLYLTADEIADLGKLAISAGASRNVAQRYLQQAEAAGTVTRPIVAGVLSHDSDKDLAAVAFHVAAYRGKADPDTPVYVLLHRLRSAWNVIEIPGRNSSVILGTPPTAYKRAP
jgi:hypothetical protein